MHAKNHVVASSNEKQRKNSGRNRYSGVGKRGQGRPSCSKTLQEVFMEAKGSTRGVGGMRERYGRRVVGAF